MVGPRLLSGKTTAVQQTDLVLPFRTYRLLGRQVRAQETIIEPSEFRDPGIGKAFA